MAETVTADKKIIVFQLREKEYAIPVSQVRSIEKVQHITRVPRTVSYIKGVINLRGVVTPIIDLRKRFELGEAEYSDTTRVIIVAINNFEVGLIVDAANDVLDIHTSEIEPPPEVVGASDVDYINGVIKIENRLMILLDLEKVLNTDDAKSSKEFKG